MRSISLGAAAIVFLANASAYAGPTEDRRGGISLGGPAGGLLRRAAAIAAAVGLDDEVRALEDFAGGVSDPARRLQVYANAVTRTGPVEAATGGVLVEVIFCPGALALKYSGPEGRTMPERGVRIRHRGFPGLRYASMRDGRRGLLVLGRPFPLRPRPSLARPYPAVSN